eukprot:2753406-Pleurochrysis_carterae.AAC.1
MRALSKWMRCVKAMTGRTVQGALQATAGRRRGRLDPIDASSCFQFSNAIKCGCWRSSFDRCGRFSTSAAPCELLRRADVEQTDLDSVSTGSSGTVFCAQPLYAPHAAARAYAQSKLHRCTHVCVPALPSVTERAQTRVRVSVSVVRRHVQVNCAGQRARACAHALHLLPLRIIDATHRPTLFDGTACGHA